MKLGTHERSVVESDAAPTSKIMHYNARSSGDSQSVTYTGLPLLLRRNTCVLIRIICGKKLDISGPPVREGLQLRDEHQV